MEHLPSAAHHSDDKSLAVRKCGRTAFRVLLIFSVLYFARPEDLIPGLNHIPIVKIAGGLTLLALIFGVRGQRAVKKFPVEIKILILMLGWLIFTIPFAWWRGGAFDTVINRFSKGVIVAVLVSLLVTRVEDLRKLLFVQASCLALMTIVSIGLYHGGRMGGILGGVFENPNELAINIAVNWPFAFAFCLLTKNILRKMIWAGAMFAMILGITLTYSRSGFLSLLLSTLVCLYQFGIKGRRIYLVMLAAIAVVLFAICTPILGLSSET